ncbi:tol-pal system protein YbgF [bacterium]|nr:tol-pal system protein YbgF [candidate division CSSED10-310 bacterium]
MFYRVTGWMLMVMLMIAGVLGCATSEPMMHRIEKLETMQRTERSESKAEYEALNREINLIMTRLDAISKTQADMVNTVTLQSEIVQNAVEKLQYSTPSTSVIQSSDSLRFRASDAQSSGTQDQAEGQQTDSGDQRPEVVYQTAYNDYINRNYDLAILEFQGFLAAFADSDLADNSQYWIGECYYAQARYDKALEQFELVLSRYPNGDKAVPALLKKGLCLIESGDVTGGQKILEELIEKHPYSSEARLAQDRLQNP